jgi:excisionase family DNA binding protein
VISVTLKIGGQSLVAELDDDALATIASALTVKADPEPEFMTIPETAELMRCSRQRVDDLLSARRLERVKDGRRTLLRRADVLAYLENGRNGRRRP